MDPAWEEILGHISEASLATGPVMALPLVSPLLLTITPALSSQQRKVPSGLRQARRCRMITAGCTFFLSFCTPFLTEQSTTSPIEPAGSLLRWPLTPWTEMMKRFLAPELSAQLRVAATGRPRVILSLMPTDPVLDFLAMWQQIILNYQQKLYIKGGLLVQMFSFFNSFGASTNFEKYRLEVTAKNYDSPNQLTLRNMMRTFCSEDTETKAQIAFATIIKKLLTSDSRSNWVYLLKNLVILDRVIEEGVFVEEISEAHFESLDNFKETDYKYSALDTQRLIKTFWKLIKEKSHTLKSKKHIFCFKRSLRQDYLATLTASETLREIQSIQGFFGQTFELVEVFSGKKVMNQKPREAQKIAKSRQQFTKSKLLEYIYLQVLHKLMLYYSCQMLCNNYFLQLLIKSKKDVKIEEIRRFRKHLIKFKANADQFIGFIEANKAIKGFQEINYKQLNPYHKDEVLKIIDKLLFEEEKPENEVISNLYYIGQDVLKVQKKPGELNDPKVLIPRLKGKSPESMWNNRDSKDNQSKIEVNQFTSWINAFSNEFPQKQIMTVDLITLLKQDESDPDESMMDAQREPNLIYYDLRETNITVDFQLNLRSDEEKMGVFYFKNIYSGLPSTWNPS